MTDVAKRIKAARSGVSDATHPASSSHRPASTSEHGNILLPALLESVPSNNPSGPYRLVGSSSPTFYSPSNSFGSRSPTNYTPRSAAISSRRGRSRSPVTTSVRSPRGSVSSPTVGLVMSKMGSSEPSAYGGISSVTNKDSRNDSPLSSKTATPGVGHQPTDVSSAAAAAAAVAATFGSPNSKSITKRSRSKDQPAQKQSKNQSVKNTWPISPSITAAASSSSSANLLSPNQDECKQVNTVNSLGTPPKAKKRHMDVSFDIVSPLDPPEIQTKLSQQIFTPKSIFEDGNKAPFNKKSTFSPIEAKNVTAKDGSSVPGIEMNASFTLFTGSFDSLGGMAGMPEIGEIGAVNSFGIGLSVTDAGGPTSSISFSILPHDSINKATKKLSRTSAPTKAGQEKTSSQLFDNSSNLLNLSPTNPFGAVLPVGGDNAVMADIVLSGGMVSRGSFEAGHTRRPKPSDQRKSSTYPAPTRGLQSRAHQHNQPVYPHNQVASAIGISPLQGAPAFYTVLRRWRKAFGRFTFVLPGLKVRETCSVNVSTVGNITLYNGPNRRFNGAEHDGTPSYTHDPHFQGKRFLDPTPQEIEIATRRVIAAVCAFGGSIQQASCPRQSSSSSIFRTKFNASGDPNVVKSTYQLQYEAQLHERFYENENRLSWEVEEKPPVRIMQDEDQTSLSKDGTDHNNAGKNRKGYVPSCARAGSPSSVDHDSRASPTPSADKLSGDAAQQKMKYRCKLCGLPKQNHICPYRHSLQRSLGTMTYPSVNAYSAAEPGRIAPALTDMNNFTDIDPKDGVQNESTPARTEQSDTSPTAGPYRSTNGTNGSNPHNVTPGSGQVGHNAHSPSSSFTGTPDGTTYRRCSPQTQMRRGEHSKLNGFGTELSSYPLFSETMQILPEQIRNVSPNKESPNMGSYTYPSLPLPYGQRKRISDSLFAMSKEINGLTDECAVVLREARQKRKWDLAIAELMAQVLIVVHCQDGDNTLEGLRRYLLTLGIVC